MPRRTGLAALALLACAAAPCAAHAGAATPARPIVAISYYSSDDLPVIGNNLEAAKLPSGTPIYYGNYWGTSYARAMRAKHDPSPTLDVPGARVAPILGWTPNKFWDYRRLDTSEERRLPPSQRKLDGAAPSLYTLLARGGSDAYRWGREIGRRFRDRARQVEELGGEVDRWQFDEVPTNAIGHGARKARDLVRGMIDGVAYGRKQLGDRKVRGIVFVANASLELAEKPVRGELKTFWRTVDRSSIALAGEEYPRFVGDPRRSAFVQSAGQREMARHGGVLRRLASKYVVAVTPGYGGATGLGGNTGGRSQEGANAWRADFLAARAAYGIAGLAAYDLLDENGRRHTVRPLFRAFATALRELGEAR